MERLMRQLRKIAREEAERTSPATRKFTVVKLKPFTIEALGSDVRLVEGDEDFEITRAVKKDAKVGDVCLVSTGSDGDRTAHGLI